MQAALRKQRQLLQGNADKAVQLQEELSKVNASRDRCATMVFKLEKQLKQAQIHNAQLQRELTAGKDHCARLCNAVERSGIMPTMRSLSWSSCVMIFEQTC